MKKILHITSGKGPQECERAAFLIIELMEKEAKRSALVIETLSVFEGSSSKLVRSALIRISGENSAGFAMNWIGTIQWIAQSPFRPHHKRKNWFVGISAFQIPEKMDWNEKDVRYESLRASGPGGQHVNKTESAVRAIHVPSGISVVASDERSQSMNKTKAAERLRLRLTHLDYERQLERERQQWEEHAQLERGNATRVIKQSLE